MVIRGIGIIIIVLIFFIGFYFGCSVYCVVKEIVMRYSVFNYFSNNRICGYEVDISYKMENLGCWNVIEKKEISDGVCNSVYKVEWIE